MFILIFTIIVIVLALAYIGWVIFRHFPDLKSIDLNSITTERQAELKHKIVAARIGRERERWQEKWSQFWSPKSAAFKQYFYKVKNKALELEAKYHPKFKNSNKQSIKEMFVAAEEMISNKDFSLAEKKLIEIIARDKKNIRAYELLGDVYLQLKNYNQAEEIYNYLIKLISLRSNVRKRIEAAALKRDDLETVQLEFLSGLNIDPRLAVYYATLAEIYLLEDKQDMALDSLLKANSIDANNPKYLDKLIELSIQLKDKGLARRTLNHLKKINPENGKIDDWQEQVEKIE